MLLWPCHLKRLDCWWFPMKQDHLLSLLESVVSMLWTIGVCKQPTGGSNHQQSTLQMSHCNKRRNNWLELNMWETHRHSDNCECLCICNIVVTFPTECGDCFLSHCVFEIEENKISGLKQEEKTNNTFPSAPAPLFIHLYTVCCSSFWNDDYKLCVLPTYF